MPKCECCGGKKRQKTREYKVFNSFLKEVVRTLVLCDLCAFPFLYLQVKMGEVENP